MTPEQLKGMNGRRVLVEGVLVDPPSSVLMATVRFSAGKAKGEAFVEPAAIREILPEPIKVGDQAKVARLGLLVTVLVIDDDAAGVRYDDGRHGWIKLSNLQSWSRANEA